MSASHFGLDNLVALIDCNGIQADGADRARHGAGRRQMARLRLGDAARSTATTWRRSSARSTRRARPRRQAEGDRAAHAARQGRADASRAARSRISSASIVGEWDGIIAEFEQRMRSSADELRPAARWPWARTRRRPRPRRRRRAVRPGAGRRSARDAAGDRRPDRRPRQVHRHPAVPRRLSRPLLQRRHGRAEPHRRRRRPRAHRARSPFATTYGVFATRRAYDFIAIACAHCQPQREDRRRPARPDDRLRRHAPGDRGSGADADDPRPHRHRPLRRDRDRRRRPRRSPTIHGPVYMRLLRGRVPVVLDPGYRFEIGKAQRAARRRAMSASSRPGFMTERALDAADGAREGAASSVGRAARADDQAVRRRGRRRLSPPRSTASSPPRTTSSSAGSPASSSRRCSTRGISRR